jgi:hypothetical protein
VDPIVSIPEKALDKLWEVNLKSSVQVVQVCKCVEFLTSMMRSSFSSVMWWLSTHIIHFLILISLSLENLLLSLEASFPFRKSAEFRDCMWKDIWRLWCS